MSPQRCPICRHSYPDEEITRHHLVPKSRKGREVVDICVHCHKQIHALFAEKELERHYNTIEALLETEAMRRWVEWVTQRKPRSRVFTKKSRRIR